VTVAVVVLGVTVVANRLRGIVACRRTANSGEASNDEAYEHNCPFHG